MHILMKMLDTFENLCADYVLVDLFSELVILVPRLSRSELFSILFYIFASEYLLDISKSTILERLFQMCLDGSRTAFDYLS